MHDVSGCCACVTCVLVFLFLFFFSCLNHSRLQVRHFEGSSSVWSPWLRGANEIPQLGVEHLTRVDLGFTA